MPGGAVASWLTPEYWSGPAPSNTTANNYFVGEGATGVYSIRTIENQTSGSSDSFPYGNGNVLWLGYNMNQTVTSIKPWLGLKSWNVTITDLRVGNAVINHGLGNGTVNLDGAMTIGGTAQFHFSGNTASKINLKSAISGNGTITLSQDCNNDNLTISHANNSFTGTLNVSQNSSIVLSGANAMQNASSIIVDSGATLKLNNTQKLNHLSGSGTVSYSSNALTLNNTTNSVFSGTITGSGSVTKTGVGALTLTAVNAYTGITTISAGTLTLSGAGNLTGTSGVSVASGATLEFKDNANITFSKVISGDGALVKTGTGNVILTAHDNTSFTGTVLVNGGTLTLGAGNVFGSPSKCSSIVVDNAVLTNDNAEFNHLRNTTFKNGAKLVAATGSSAWKAFMLSGYTNIDFSGDGSVAENPVIFEVSSTATGTDLANATICSRASNTINVADITKSADSDLIVSAVLADSYDNTTYYGTINKSGAGTMELTAVNTFTGPTNVNAGTLKLTGNGNLTGTSGVSVASGATLEFKDNANITFSKEITGAGALVKSGTGTVTLTQALTNLSGNTTISGGGLTLSNSSVASTLNNLIGGSLIADGADSDVFVNLTSNANLTLNNADMTKFIGSITASGLKIEKTGNGTLQIYTGATGKVDAQSITVSSGELDLKGYMTGGISVEGPNAVFSPGNSVGDAVFGGGYILKEGATLLIEQDETGIDTLTASSFGLVGNDNHIEFDFTAFAPGKEYDYIILTDGFGEGQNEPNYWTALYTGNLPDYFTTSVFINDDGYGVVRLTAPSANAVPEPSTWALLLLGAAGLLYVRKRTRK